MMAVTFSIVILSYNRHDLVEHTLRSVLGQTYPNLEVLLVDNGSEPPLDDLLRRIPDSRVRYFRYALNTHMCDVGEEVINYLSGSHLLFLADDDVLMPNALEIVAGVLESNPQMESLGVGFVHFDHIHSSWQAGRDDFNLFTGQIEYLNGEETAIAFCNGWWGIGKKCSFRLPRTAHSSASFVSMQLIRKTIAKQGQLFVKPFGDIGYVGCAANAAYIGYLNLPLAVIGKARVREMDGAKPGHRHKWNKEVQFLEHSPLKAPSFINMGTDAHLKVMYRNGLHEKYDSRLRPDFFREHLKAVVSDSPWTLETVRDVCECLPYFLFSLFQFTTFDQVLVLLKKTSRWLVHLPWRAVRKAIRSIHPRNHSLSPSLPRPVSDCIEFANINEFAEWVDRNHVQRLIKTSNPHGISQPDGSAHNKVGPTGEDVCSVRPHRSDDF